MAIQQRVSTWGNSLGIRLPQAIAQQVGFTEGVSISISVEGDKVVLSPARPKYNLDELLKEATPDRQHDEIDWGESAGEETW
ncbi:MAG: AbrB/MazE/SpoVT family DNA-binding domain-containing protein [Cyanobacteria bacterium P01_A01_bin.116]